MVSVHDVMAETLPQVKVISELLEQMAVFPAALPVVPGRRWSRLDWSGNYLKGSARGLSCDLTDDGRINVLLPQNPYQL